jgi:sulfite reductase alpha subunit-like flavoprotein
MPAVAAAAAAATVVAAAAATTQAVAKAAPAAATAPAAGEAPAALTGSAAILAKLRQQRSSGAGAANASLKHDGSKVTVLYASQTGTGQEIARAIHAQCAAQGVPAQVMSMNELGFHNLRPDKTPVVVVVASSTGAGRAGRWRGSEGARRVATTAAVRSRRHAHSR